MPAGRVQVALPHWLTQAPGRWFLLAGFLKVLYLCQPTSPFASMTLLVFGRPTTATSQRVAPASLLRRG